MDPKLPKFYNLPFEILEYILNYDSITHIELGRLSSVCQVFTCVTKSNKLWQSKYKRKWPQLYALYDPSSVDWKNEYRLRHECKKLASQRLQIMSIEFYDQDNVSNEVFLQYKELLPGHPFSHNIFIDELEQVLHDGESHLNLTQKYYAKRVLRFMRQTYLQAVWKDFLARPPNQQTLEEGACLLARWCQPTRRNFSQDVSNELNKMAKRVLEKVKIVAPRHPVIKNGLLKPAEMLTTSLWTPQQCRTILQCLNTVMFEEMQFCGNRDNFYCTENTFIDIVMVVKKGIPITLGIIYTSVALRLGVACLSVNFPGHFLLKWLEHPQLSDEESYTFIDMFENGAFKTWKDLLDLVPGYGDQFTASWFEAVPPIKVFIRMCWNLVEVGRQLDEFGEGLFCLCDSLELLSLLNPSDMEHKLLLARVYMHMSINLTEVITLLQELASYDPMATGLVGYMYQKALTILETQKSRRNSELKKKVRNGSTNVKYAVGMIMRHKKYSYRCVIFGWDNICTASKDWIKQMGVYNLAKKDKQPFYQVLVDDGTNRYAAQENLEIDQEQRPISHRDVGRYFESYHGYYYIPNESKNNEYPEDCQVREVALFHVNG